MAFDDIVAAHTGDDFVDRAWLSGRSGRIESALTDDGCRYVLLTAEPGAGKTTALAAIAAAHPEWPRWFTRRDSASPLGGDGASGFLRSIGHQLARARPSLFPPVQLELSIRQRIQAVEAGGRVVGYEVDELVVSPFAMTAIAVEQDIGKVEGEVVGVDIRRAVVDERLLPIDVLVELAILEPAARLADLDPGAQLVILIDALDEIADGDDSGVLDWLQKGPDLPGNVRFVLTSREFHRLDLLRLGRPGQVTELGIDPRSAEVRDDLAVYAARILGAAETLRAIEEQGSTVDELVDGVADRAQGNFAYLAAYERALVDAMQRLDRTLRDRLLRLADVPVGPVGLYDLFMATAHQDISSMRMFDVAHPQSERGTVCPAWEHVGQAVIGVLAVVREPVTEDQIARLSQVRVWPRDVANVVERLSPYLNRSVAGVALFHPSFAAYLLDDDLRSRHRAWAVDAAEWHEKIIRCARPCTTSWDDVDWTGVEPYVVRHVAFHLSRCRDWLADQLPELITPALRAAQCALTGTDSAFLVTIELAEQRAASHLSPEQALPVAVLLGAVARQLQGVDTVVPPELAGVLARRDRVTEALGLVNAQPPSLNRVEGLCSVLRWAPAGALDDAHRRDLRSQLVQDARQVPLTRRWGHVDTTDRRAALLLAAEVVAPFRPDLGLRLAQEAGPMTGHHSGEDEAAEASVLRAALPALPDDRGAQLVAGLMAGRAGAWLDLADRAASSAEREQLLTRAETDLDTETIASGMVCRARLAVAWAPISTARSREWEDNLDPDLDGGPGTGHGPTEERRRNARLEAVTRIAEIDRPRARAWLDRCGDIGAEAVRLWLRWGDEARARAVVEEHSSGDESLPAAALLALVDPDVGGRRVDVALDGESRFGPQPFLEGMYRDENLALVAGLLAPGDPDRARAVARRISGREFGETGTERVDALAGIAHADLDAGRIHEADELVAECLSGIDTAPDAGVGGIPIGVPIRIGTAPPTADRIESLMGSSYTTNLHQDWLHRCRRELFLTPVELTRAILPMPYALGSPYCWERTTRAWVDAIGCQDRVGAEALLNRLGDPGERAVGLAGLEEQARAAHDEAAATRLRSAADAALAEIPPYGWTFDRAEALAFFNQHKQTVYAAPGHVSKNLEQDPEDALDYVLPDRRARFEVAVRRSCVGAQVAPDPSSDHLRQAVRGEGLCRESARLVGMSRPGAAPPTEFHRRHADEQTASDPLTRIVRCRLVAGDRVLTDHATWDAVGRQISSASGEPLSVTDPVDVGLMHIIAVRAGVPASEQLLALVSDLLLYLPDRLVAVARLAALAAAATARLDSGAANRLIGQTLATLRASDDGYARGVGLARLAKPSEVEGLVDTGALVDEAVPELDGSLGVNRRQELLSVLFPVMVRRRPAAAAQLISTALREDWREAMALLEWSAEALVETYGPSAAQQCVVALERAQAFRGRAA